MHICGPGGIGKSTLLREVARHARDRGISVLAIDGRELGPRPARSRRRCARPAGDDRLLVLLDSYERMTALDSHLRHELLPELPDRALVLIAGRGAPDPGWFTGGWEAVTARLDLAGLSRAEARHLLAARGLTDSRVSAIIDWAAGSPLALALAADAAIADSGWNAASAPDRPDILRSLLNRLVETELHGVHPSALGIAVVARTTTPDLLRAVLPGEDAERRYRAAVRAHYHRGARHRHHPARARAQGTAGRPPAAQPGTGARPAAAHRRLSLLERGMAGDQMMMIDLAHLVENPLLRWGFGWDGNVSFRIDSVRPGDADRIEPLTSEHNRAVWQLTRRYFAEAPGPGRDRPRPVRSICGFLVSMSLATAPAFADQDPLAGPWLAHARRNAALGDSVMWHAAVDFTAGPGPGHARHRRRAALRFASPRSPTCRSTPRLPGAVDFAGALGASHLGELDVSIGDAIVQCYRLDYGPGGIFTFMRDQIYAELGLAAPGRPRLAVPDLETVREILRNFRVPRELARSPLARGATVAERAESVQRLVRQAADEAFGDSETEKLLRSVLIAGYLEPLRSHEEAANRLLLSRAAYFRRLRTAVERLAEHLADADAGAPADVA